MFSNGKSVVNNLRLPYPDNVEKSISFLKEDGWYSNDVVIVIGEFIFTKKEVSKDLLKDVNYSEIKFPIKPISGQYFSKMKRDKTLELVGREDNANFLGDDLYDEKDESKGWKHNETKKRELSDGKNVVKNRNLRNKEGRKKKFFKKEKEIETILGLKIAENDD